MHLFLTMQACISYGAIAMLSVLSDIGPVLRRRGLTAQVQTKRGRGSAGFHRVIVITERHSFLVYGALAKGKL